MFFANSSSSCVDKDLYVDDRAVSRAITGRVLTTFSHGVAPVYSEVFSPGRNAAEEYFPERRFGVRIADG